MWETCFYQSAKVATFLLITISRYSKDNLIYLKQLLKISCVVDVKTLRPFIVMLYVLSKVGELSDDEFTYLLPLCTSKETTDEIIGCFDDVRKGQKTVNDIIISRLFSMPNYKEAYALFLSQEQVDEDLICEIGINRKSRVATIKSIIRYIKLCMRFI